MRATIAAALTILATAAPAEEPLTSVILFDPFLDPYMVACKDPMYLGYHNTAITKEMRDFKERGDPVDPRVLDAMAEDECLTLAKGSHGHLYKDDRGRFYAYVASAELGDGEYQLDFGKYYFYDYVYRSDVATLINLDQYR